MLTHAKPKATSPATAAPATSDEFNSLALGQQWQWQANPRPEFFSLATANGALRLACVAAPSPTSLYDAPNLLLQKFFAPAFTATTVVEFASARDGEEAGLIVFGYNYAWIGLRKTATGLRVVQITNVDANKPSAERESASLAATANRVFLRVTVAADAKCRFAYSADGQSFTPLGDELQATVARWVGAKVGVFAASTSGSASSGQGHADFDFFHVTP